MKLGESLDAISRWKRKQPTKSISRRLYETAPELLAVCQAVYKEMCRWPDQEGPLKRRLHEAIEKAEGNRP